MSSDGGSRPIIDRNWIFLDERMTDEREGVPSINLAGTSSKKIQKKEIRFFFIADQTTDDGRDGRDETSGSWEGFLSRMQKKDELSSCVCDDEQVAEKRNNLFY